MGWFWGNSNNKGDPTKQLDPSLKDYLEKEAPAKYEPTTATAPPARAPSYREQLKQVSASQVQEAPDEDKPQVPAASHFQDGRYAHLWKNYQPLEALEGPSETPAEKVLDHVKKRKNVLNEAALENCAEEHLALATCFKTGDFTDRIKAHMTLCQLENSRFARCYTMQHVCAPTFWLPIRAPCHGPHLRSIF